MLSVSYRKDRPPFYNRPNEDPISVRFPAY